MLAQHSADLGTNRTIAFTRRNICDFREQLRRMNADGTSNISLGRCPETCEWMDDSPDATALALTSCTVSGEGNYSRCRIVRRVMATGATNAASPLEIWAQDPAWAPSGTRILYGDGAGNVVVTSPTGATTRTLIRNAEDPNWQPVLG
jgi:hypothetical protein